MKKFLTAALLLINFSANSQNNKWFVSVSTGYVFGGPGPSLKKQMSEKGFGDDKITYASFSNSSSKSSYPKKSTDGNFLIRGGKKMNDKRSLYFCIGKVNTEEVEGFKRIDNTGALAGSVGQMAGIKYTIWQLTAGVMYSKNKKTKLALGPSAFIINYNLNSGDNQTKLIPGASFTGRFPLGKEKKPLGIDFMIDINLAPPVKMDVKSPGIDAFQPGAANMIHGTLGFAISLRE